MDKTVPKDQASDNNLSAQLRGETIAYAVQHAVYNLGANLFEPYLNYRTQKYYSRHDPSHPGHGNYTQNLAGEFAGDIIGASSLILAEALIPTQLHAFTRKARGWVDPLYTSVAHKVLAGDKSQPDYAQEVERWKTFQERNLIRSLIMATAGIAGNVVTQKTLIKNPSPASVILKGKLLSTAITTTMGLAVRFTFPDHMRRVDKWIGGKVFAPMLEDKEIVSHPDR
jgi:hypothetical protein